MPKVSVIIPTHERPMFLIRALKSVRAQTFTDYEIIIISNGESYQDRAINRSTAQFYGASFIELDKGNVSLARNAGIEAAKGEWIAFLDDDDEWLPKKLEKQMNRLGKCNGMMISCDYYEVYSDNHVKTVVQPRFQCEKDFTTAISHQHWWALPSAVVVKRSVIAGLNGFDPKIGYSEDNDMWRRISWENKIVQMDEILVNYYIGHSRLMTNSFRKTVGDIKHLLKMYSDTPQHLRYSLPKYSQFVMPRLKWLLPYFVRQPRKSFLSVFKRMIRL